MTFDWAEDLAKQKKLELERKKLRDEKVLSERKLVASMMDKMWGDVRSAVFNSVNEYNHAMGSADVQLGEPRTREIELVAYGQNRHIAFMADQAILRDNATPYSLKVVEGKGVVWKNQQDNDVSSEMIAQIAVSGVVNAKPYG